MCHCPREGNFSSLLVVADLLAPKVRTWNFGKSPDLPRSWLSTLFGCWHFPRCQLRRPILLSLGGSLLGFLAPYAYWECQERMLRKALPRGVWLFGHGWCKNDATGRGATGQKFHPHFQPGPKSWPPFGGLASLRLTGGACPFGSGFRTLGKGQSTSIGESRGACRSGLTRAIRASRNAGICSAFHFPFATNLKDLSPGRLTMLRPFLLTLYSMALNSMSKAAVCSP